MVTVVVPTYNAEATIRDQLAALDRQDLGAPWETIVVDNGSTDGTVDVLRQWVAGRDDATLLDASHRRGASAARNVGAAAASAPLLAFCDADDVVDDGWLSAMVTALENADLVAGVVESDSLADPGHVSVSWTTQPPITLGFWPELPAGATNNLAVRASVFAAVDGFDEGLTHCEDIDFCWRAQLAGHTFATSAAAVVAIRKRVGRRAVLRQAYQYGRGESVLRRKWAEEAERYHARRGAGTGSQEPTAAPAGGQPPTALRRVGRVLTRLGSASQQADLLWRVGFGLGLRTGDRDGNQDERSRRAGR